jgi:hypothetical protein
MDGTGNTTTAAARLETTGLMNADELRASLLGLQEYIDEVHEKAGLVWESLAFKNGFDLERGDQILLPPDCEFIVPKKWEKQIRKSPYVTCIMFLRAIGYVQR